MGPNSPDERSEITESAAAGCRFRSIRATVPALGRGQTTLLQKRQSQLRARVRLFDLQHVARPGHEAVIVAVLIAQRPIGAAGRRSAPKFGVSADEFHGP